MAARDFEGSFGSGRKKLFQFVGVLSVADTVAEQDHAVFHVPRLPSVQKMAGRRQCKHVTRVCRSFLFGRMAVRSGPDGHRWKNRQ